MATALRGGRVLAAFALAIVFFMPTKVGAQTPTLTITLTAQSVIRSDIRAHAPAAVPIIKSLLKGDVIFNTFEGTIIKEGQPEGGGYSCPPEAIEDLKDFGFNLLALANNHSFDYKVQGVENMLEVVNRLNLAHAGIGNTIDEAAAPGYLKTPKGTVALVAMASGNVPAGAMATATQPGVNELRVVPRYKAAVEAQYKPEEEDAQRNLQSIQQAKKQADLVIAYVHNHVLEKPFPAMMEEELPERMMAPVWLQKWAHALVDGGADIVMMDNVLIMHGVEIYHGHPIIYGLGNFIRQAPPSSITFDEPIIWEGLVANLDYQGKKLRSIQFHPIAQNKIGEGLADFHGESNNLFVQTRGLPKPVMGQQAHYILERLADLSRPLGTTVVVKDDVAEINLEGGN